jgi:hypothetical protein
MALSPRCTSLLCFWTVRELGMSLTELARHLGISVPCVGYDVERRKPIARYNNSQITTARGGGLIILVLKGTPRFIRLFEHV